MNIPSLIIGVKLAEIKTFTISIIKKFTLAIYYKVTYVIILPELASGISLDILINKKYCIVASHND